MKKNVVISLISTNFSKPALIINSSINVDRVTHCYKDVITY